MQTHLELVSHEVKFNIDKGGNWVVMVFDHEDIDILIDKLIRFIKFLL